MTHQASEINKVLTIATSDSGGGAGIQTDIKTISALGAYATSVFVALTAQNTLGVQAIHELPLDFIGQQIDSVLSDIGTDAAKTGMLFSKEIVTFVAQKVREYKVPNLVVDPVMVATSGDVLLKPDAVDAYRKELLPLALLATPNRHEARILSGLELDSPARVEDAARIIHGFGCPYVLIKGGHFNIQSGMITDILYDGDAFHEYGAHYVNTRHTHGTGCTLSAALAAHLALGMSIYTAVERSKVFITRAIENCLCVGTGNGPTNPFKALE